jgi:type I restriction enzyme S subunit
MEVRAGYKKTDVGVIPEQWDVAPIKKNAVIKTGSKNTQDRVADGIYPFFVRSQNVERINSFSYEGEAVLTAGDGVGTGKVFHYINGRFDYHQRVYRISDFSDELSGRYFFKYFSANFLDRIMKMTAKSSVDSVRLDMIADMQIAIPPVKEQKAIANALSDVDQLIASLDQLIAKKRDLKQAAMQQLLTGKTRLQGFSGEWVQKRLGDVAEVIMGQSPSSQHYNTKGNGLPLIQGNADLKHRKTIERVFSESVTKLGLAGDIVMSVRAPVGEIAVASSDVCLGRGVCALRYQNDYLFHYLVYCEDRWSRLSKGSTFDAVNGDDIRAFMIERPVDEREQVAIASVLSDMDFELTELEQRRNKTIALKQGMMQELLTGRTRLV